MIVATGAQRTMPDIPGADQDFVFSGDQMRSLILAEKNPALRRKISAFTRFMVSVGALTGISGIPGLVRFVSRFWLPLGRDITIIGAELVGLELAEYLAERGRNITVIDNPPKAGKGLYLVRRMRLLEELGQLGVVLINNAAGIAIEDRRITYSNYRGQRRAISADHVIVAQGASGNLDLAKELEAAGLKTQSIGDCNGVTYIEGAMEAAARLAAEY